MAVAGRFFAVRSGRGACEDASTGTTHRKRVLLFPSPQHTRIHAESAFARLVRCRRADGAARAAADNPTYVVRVAAACA